MENSFASLISSANKILILLPNKPYLDQVAASLSLYLSLLGTGKKVSVFCPVTMTTEYSRLIAVDKITNDLENHNLTIKFINYEATNVDKVNYDIEGGQFKLIITPKSGFKSPNRDQIDINYSGISSDLTILIGGANDSHFPILTKNEFKNSKLVHVGTRLLEILNNELEILSFAKPASSTSELIAALLTESGFTIDADIATNLLAGIEDQSKNFQNSDVTADTFLVFAELLKLGGKRMSKIISAKNYPQGSIPTRPFNQMTPEEAEKELNQEIPASWSEPKIFTGTSLSWFPLCKIKDWLV